MKEYFVYQKGSYWIYKDDSTGLLDSTYVSSYNDITNDNGYSGMTREIIILSFKSQFLSDFELGYFCPGSNCLTIASKLEYPNDTNSREISGPYAYYPGWEPNKNIISNECIPGWVFTYSIIASDTIDSRVYNNIIYSKIMTTDSTSTNQYFYSREIYFAKNIGIVKFIEKSKYYDIQRSLSLNRYKVIQ